MRFHLDDSDWSKYLAARNIRRRPHPGILRSAQNDDIKQPTAGTME
jgi:hypothetical protein